MASRTTCPAQSRAGATSSKAAIVVGLSMILTGSCKRRPRGTAGPAITHGNGHILVHFRAVGVLVSSVVASDDDHGLFLVDRLQHRANGRIGPPNSG